MSATGESPTTAVGLYDADMRFRGGNEELARQAGRGVSELIGKRCHRVWCPWAQQTDACICREVLRTGRAESVFCRDAENRLWRIHLEPLSDSDARSRLLMRAVEVTDVDAPEQGEHRSEQRFRTIFKNAAFGIAFATPEGRLVEVNPAFCEIVGYSAEELTQMRVQDFSHPEDVDREREVIRAIRNGRLDRYRVEKRYICKEGRQVWVDVVVTGIFAFSGELRHVVGIVEDISERKRAMQALRTTQFIVDHAPDAVVWIDEQGRFFYVNESAGRLFGRSAEEMLTLRADDVDTFYAEGHDWQADWERFSRAGGFCIEQEITRPDGTTVPVEINASLLQFEDRPIGCVVLRDLTERRRIQQEKHRAEKLESLGVLAGGIAHDFNNLLMVILGNTEMLASELPDDESAGRVGEIRNAAVRASELTRRLLAYSGKEHLTLEPVDLNALVDETALGLARSIAPEAEVVKELDPELPACRADETQMRRVVSDLVANAAEAIGDEPGKITVATGACEVDESEVSPTGGPGAQMSGMHLFLQVRDTGCGMDESVLSHLFDPFFSTKFMGRGLGLPAVLGIVRAHEGAVQVESEPGKGSTFRILLPCLKQPEATDREPASSAGAAQAPGEAPPGRSVLLVDDDPDVRRVARAMLQRHDIGVVEAEGIQAAVDRLGEEPGRFGAVLLDSTMLRLGGRTVPETIHNLRADLPVIVISGYAENQAGAGEAEGAFAFLQKPFDIDELLEVVRSAIDAAGGES